MNPIEEFEDIRQHKLERCGEETYFPKIGKAIPGWEKSSITAGQLMEDNTLQLWIGNKDIWTYDIWKQTGTPQANEIGRHWDNILNYLPDTEYMQNHTDRIGSTLTNLVLYNSKETTGIEFPLFFFKSRFMLPLSCGSVLDGNHRLLSILSSLSKGEIQESSPVPIWSVNIPDMSVFAYNMLALYKMKMPIDEKLKLLSDRILVGKKK